MQASPSPSKVAGSCAATDTELEHMAYELDPTRPVPEEARRVLLEQTDLAIAGFVELPEAEAVHEARKACKRARALLGLVESGPGRSRCRATGRAYRDAAREISSLRDDEVMARTLAELMDPDAAGLPAPASPAADSGTRLDAVVAGLQAARALADELPWRAIGRGAVLEGFEAGYRAARRGRRTARRSQAHEPMHQWRKVAKANLYHWELLRGLWPPLVTAVHSAIDELQEVLGDYNDLAVLGRRLADADLPDATRAEVKARLAVRMPELRSRAFALARPIYAAPVRVYPTLARALWREIPTAGPAQPRDGAAGT